LEAAWPDARTVELNDVGHYVMEEAPETVIEQVREILKEC
jgi:pimeloyl-ACP methyl ester carboxylesterase